MSLPVISVENISKSYQLGVIGTGSFRGDLQRWWAKRRGLSDPYLKIGEKESDISINETFWALKNVSFSVQQGEAIGIIGRNGAGKSTLLKILSRVTAPTSGIIKAKGRIASLLEVGTGFHPELTGRENVFLNGAIMGMSKAEIQRKFDEIVDFSGVEKYIDTPVKRYSSGMYVRLGFAVAAHLDPDILIVDEVLAVGDFLFQKKSGDKMREVVTKGKAVIFVSHSGGAIKKLCDRAIVLEKGEVVMENTAEVAVNHYLEPSMPIEASEIILPDDAMEGAPGKGVVLRIMDENQKPRTKFKINEKVVIQLDFEVLCTTEQVVAAVGVRTLDGHPVVTHWSQALDLDSGTYRTIFEYDLKIKSTKLLITVGLTSKNKPFYYHENVGIISITREFVGKKPFLVSGAGLLVGDQSAEICRV